KRGCPVSPRFRASGACCRRVRSTPSPTSRPFTARSRWRARRSSANGSSRRRASPPCPETHSAKTTASGSRSRRRSPRSRKGSGESPPGPRRRFGLPDLPMPAAFVTGGTGFVGWHVAKALLAEGWSVRALARGGPLRRTGLDELPVDVVSGDLPASAASAASATSYVDRALQGCSAVVHCAGLVKARSLADYRAVNVLGTEHLV